ncbi:MAG: hypothetical protein CBC82_05505 [Cellvibrionales bacterium TMED122]|nr:MAG: hypothetical protein CBC82_05505 [Cellvibrionales bacterium TMED122]|tara:strand:+ start:173 stop:490 length:318 start_codon:yes stop_codon:yes gene_type:complete
MEEVGLLLAGLIGGMVNSIAEGGSFITFPALLAAGVPPIAANATNTFASCAGYLSGTAGYRHALWTHRSQLPRLALLAMTPLITKTATNLRPCLKPPVLTTPTRA